VKLLPFEKAIAESLGISEQEYGMLLAEINRRNRTRPAAYDQIPDIQNIALLPIVGKFAIGGLLSLFGKKRQTEPPPPPPPPKEFIERLDIKESSFDTSASRYSTNYGWQGFGAIASLGQPVPRIYTKEQTIDGQIVGGVRVNLLALWTEALSYGNSQMLRYLGLVGDGELESVPYEYLASGNDLLTDKLAHRAFLYANLIGGTISPSDKKYGDADPTSSQIIYQYLKDNSLRVSGASQAVSPSGNQSFGCYSFIGNQSYYRMNWEMKADPNNPKAFDQRVNRFWPIQARITSSVNNVHTWQVFNDGTNTGVVEVKDSIKGIVNGWRDSLVQGDTYWVGKALCRLSFRQDDNRVEFTSIESGEVRVITGPSRLTGLTLVNGGTALVNGTYNDIPVVGVTSGATTAKVSSIVIADGAITTLGTVTDYGGEKGYVNGEQVWFDLENGVSKVGEISFSTYPNNTPRTLGTTFTITFHCTFGSTVRTESVNLNIDRNITVYNDLDGVSRLAAIFNDAFEKFRSIPELVGKPWPYRAEGKIVSGAGKMEIYRISNLAPANGQYLSFTKLDFLESPTPPYYTYNLTFTSNNNPFNSTTAYNIQAVVAVDNSVEIPYGLFESDLHICRATFASAVNTRPVDGVDLGFRSECWVRQQSVTHGWSIVNQSVLLAQLLATQQANDVQIPVNIVKLTGYERAYRVFRLDYRVVGSKSSWTPIKDGGHEYFALTGATPVNRFDYLKIRYSQKAQYEFRIVPVPPWVCNRTNVVILDQTAAPVNWTIAPFTFYCRGRILYFNSDDTNNFSLPAFFVAIQGSWWSKGHRFNLWDQLQELQFSCATSPDCELAYVNEYVDSAIQANYAGLATVGANLYGQQQVTDVSQLSAYVRAGNVVDRLDGTRGASSLFPDIAYDVLKLAGVSDDLIHLDGFNAAAEFCNANRYAWDGVVASRVNIREWLTDNAPASLLTYGDYNGQHSLFPAWLPSMPVRGMFTDDNILDYEETILSPNDVGKFKVTVTYRTQSDTFPQNRVLTMRWADGAESDSELNFDFSSSVTYRKQVLDFCQWLLRLKRYQDRTATIRTIPESWSVVPGDVIAVATTVGSWSRYSLASSDRGYALTTSPITDGQYRAVYLAPGMESPGETVVTAVGGAIEGLPERAIALLGGESTTVRYFRVEAIAINSEGEWQIDAAAFPMIGDSPMIKPGDDSEFVIEG
jgi:hypothetical protein